MSFLLHMTLCLRQLLLKGIRITWFIFALIDPFGRPTVTAGRDNCFPTCRPLVCPSVRPHFSKSSKTKQQKTMFATGETVGLAERIIGDTCLVLIILIWKLNSCIKVVLWSLVENYAQHLLHNWPLKVGFAIFSGIRRYFWFIIATSHIIILW